MYEIISAEQVKRWLNISDDSMEDFVEDLRSMATTIMESYIDKQLITRLAPTQYFSGKNQSDLLSLHYPIYKVVSLHDDITREFTAETLFDSSDYVIDHDSGRIILAEQLYFTTGINNIKLVYYAGLSEFEIVPDSSESLSITDVGGTDLIKIPAQTAYPHGIYDADDLATAIGAAINSSSTLSGVYSVSYNKAKQKFSISADVNFGISITTDSTSIGQLIGFTNDMTGKTSYLSDKSVNGIPNDLILAAQQICDLLFDQSKNGIGIQNVKKRTLSSGGGDYEYLVENLPAISMKIMDRYKRMYA